MVIVACGTETEYVMPCGQYTYPIDVTISVYHMSLEAVSQGLGTCWIGAFHENQVKDILGIPEKISEVAMLTLGYPAETHSGPRKLLEEIISYERW